MAFNCCLDASSKSIRPCLQHFLPASLTGRGHPILASQQDITVYRLCINNKIYRLRLPLMVFIFIGYKLSGTVIS